MREVDTQRELARSSPNDAMTFRLIMNSVEAGCSYLASAIRRRDDEAVQLAGQVSGLLTDGHTAYQRFARGEIADARSLAGARKLLTEKLDTAVALFQEMMEDGMPENMRRVTPHLRDQLAALTVEPASTSPTSAV